MSNQNLFADASIICPDIERFEEGSNVSIKCNINGSDNFDILWYRGKIPKVELILELKNGRSGELDHHKKAYGITSSGALTIYNLKEEHAGSYFILVHYKNKTRVGRHIEVKLTGELTLHILVNILILLQKLIIRQIIKEHLKSVPNVKANESFANVNSCCDIMDSPY